MNRLGKKCVCGALATYTFYTRENTMSWLCTKHAHEVQAEVRNQPDLWRLCCLVPSVEETDEERMMRLEQENVLWND